MKTRIIEPKKVLVVSTKTTLKNIAKDTYPLCEALMEDVKKFGITPAGPLEFIYFGASGDMEKEFELEIALPVSPDTTAQGSRYKIKDTKPFKCATYIHKGGVDKLFAVYEELFKELDWDKMKSTEEVREVYQNWVSPESEENITEIQIGIN